ncbi:MAG: hypothetical protein LBD11_01080 [Candidatus Peribacteria bacterium]|jgi:hypothetical protein|nr:hypothetical protein [Candidatus Peribacteria bacterium]
MINQATNLVQDIAKPEESVAEGAIQQPVYVPTSETSPAPVAPEVTVPLETLTPEVPTPEVPEVVTPSEQAPVA